MSAAWAAGTPRTEPQAGWCLAYQLSSSGHTHMPALEWPVCIYAYIWREKKKRCSLIYSKRGRSKYQATAPVKLHDVAYANITYVVKINSASDKIRCPNYHVRVEKNWISASLIKESKHTHTSTCLKTALNHTVNKYAWQEWRGASLALVKMHERSPYGEEYVQKLFVLATPGLDKTWYSAAKATQWTDLLSD